jgi:adhesin transport system outer membrane protein
MIMMLVVKLHPNCRLLLTRILSVFIMLTVAMLSTTMPSLAVSLKDAVAVALDSNPDIGQSIENREAHEFELRQAKGLLLPSLDLEASFGKRKLDNPSRRRLGLDHDALNPATADLVFTQKLFDGGRIRAEIDHQASKVDSASIRVLERSEYIGLQVVKEYLEYLLQSKIVAESAVNLRDHRKFAKNVSVAANSVLTDADRQQARERVLAAKARLQEAEEDISATKIRFFKLTGVPLTNARLPRSVVGRLPKSLDRAIALGRTNNPRVHMAKADIDAADARVAGAKSNLLPEAFFEGRTIAGNDIDGIQGATTDLQARIVLKWNLYRGGIKKADEQEQIRRASEQRMILHQVHRDLEQAVRTSWDRRIRRARLAETLRQQTQYNLQLVSSYTKQFRINKRSLLDVLDAQNTKYNTSVLAVTAEYASLFSQYRLLAATGTLLKTLKLVPARQSDAYARAEFNVPITAPTETYKRTPARQFNDLPMDLLAPIRRN